MGMQLPHSFVLKPESSCGMTAGVAEGQRVRYVMAHIPESRPKRLATEQMKMGI
jgi:hypothetical protein